MKKLVVIYSGGMDSFTALNKAKNEGFDVSIIREIVKIRENDPEKQAEKEALLEMVDGLRNYCEAVAFEISPRNVTVRSGKLVLLDCFFDPFALSAKGFPIHRNQVIDLAVMAAFIALILLIHRDHFSVGGWLRRHQGQRWWQ